MLRHNYVHMPQTVIKRVPIKTRQGLYCCYQLIFLITTIFLLSTSLVNAHPFANINNKTSQSNPETVQIIVTTRTITVGANFNGIDFYVAGALENFDPDIRKNNGYDIAVLLEGPQQKAYLYKKERRFGVWLNGRAREFTNVPEFYALATTQNLADIAEPQTYHALQLGLDNLPLQMPWPQNSPNFRLYKNELIAIKEKQNLYHENIGAVRFGSANLFSVHFDLPENIPVGKYTVKAYLFRNGTYLDQAITGVDIVRDNLAYTITVFTKQHSFWYGIIAVIIAIIIGFLGRLIFRK